MILRPQDGSQKSFPLLQKSQDHARALDNTKTITGNALFRLPQCA